MLAWWVGGVFTGVSVLCIAFMFGLRFYADYKKKRSKRVSEDWDPALFAASYEDEDRHETIPILREIDPEDDLELEEPPDFVKNGVLMRSIKAGRFEITRPLEDRELPDFLHTWNYIHESTRGRAKERLNVLASRLQIEDKAFDLLKSPLIKTKLLAVNTLGNLREKSAYDAVSELLSNPDPIISLWAWRALFRIDFYKTSHRYFSLAVEREDWSPIFVAKVLRELDVDLLSVPLCRLVKQSFDRNVTERQLSRVISYLTYVHPADYTPLVEDILANTEKPEAIIACLRLIKNNDLVETVRKLAKHELWEVRMQAVLTLGRLGNEEDIELLIESLNDLDWWVRYRAAAALFAMPGVTEEYIEELSQTLPNPFSRDILQHALAEVRMLCSQPVSNLLSK